MMRIRILLIFKVIKSATTGLQTLQGSILSLHASIGRVYGPPRLHCEPLKLLNFVFSADADLRGSALLWEAGSRSALKGNLDPQLLLQPCFYFLDCFYRALFHSTLVVLASGSSRINLQFKKNSKPVLKV
jgi:hypothetical protein